MATRTIADGGGNWTANGTWVEGAAPTASDDVVATATSGNVTIDAAAACRSADFTGYVGTLTHNAGVTWSIGTSTVKGDSVGLKFVSGMTYTLGNATSSALTFVSSSGTQTTVTLAGKTVGGITFNGVGGNWILQDSITTAGNVTHTRGTFNTNSKTINCRAFAGSGTNARTLTLGSSAITCTQSSANAWGFTDPTNLTFTANTATITLTGASPNFAGGGLTYGGTVSFTGTGTLTVTGANTIATLTAASAVGDAAKTVTFPASATTTVTNLTLTGLPGALLSLQSSSAGTAATVSVAAGTVRLQYTLVKDITGSGGATFRALNSTNVSGNTGITFVTFSAGEELPAALNRLAGTTGLDATGAANVLAGTSGLELVGALNAYVGTQGVELQGVLTRLGRGG